MCETRAKNLIAEKSAEQRAYKQKIAKKIRKKVFQVMLVSLRMIMLCMRRYWKSFPMKTLSWQTYDPRQPKKNKTNKTTNTFYHKVPNSWIHTQSKSKALRKKVKSFSQVFFSSVIFCSIFFYLTFYCLSRSFVYWVILNTDNISHIQSGELTKNQEKHKQQQKHRKNNPLVKSG